MFQSQASQFGQSNNTSPQSTTSNSSSFTSLAEEFDSFFVWDTQKKSWDVRKDWQGLEDSVMDFFEKAGIDVGSPSALQNDFYEEKKKNLVLENLLKLKREGKKNKLGQNLKVSV